MNESAIVIGVVGYSGQKFDEAEASSLLSKAFDQIVTENPDKEIRVASGYTNVGIPALAYKEAVRRGWKTIGIACAKAFSYDRFPCDDVLIIGTNWGDESQEFLETSDVLVRVGGGKQSLAEVATAKSMGKRVHEFELVAQS